MVRLRNTNGSAPSPAWTVQAIPARDMPPSSGKWWPLYRDVLRRLEKTPAHQALAYRLTGGGAASALSAITRYANERGLPDNSFVMTYEKLDDSASVLYVRRGSGWTNGISPVPADQNGLADDVD